MTNLFLSLFIITAAVQSETVSGVWVVNDVPYAPWTLELKQNGTSLTGSVRQNGALTGPSEIYAGSVNGTTLSFKAKSPDDGARTITFTGTLQGDKIAFHRSAEATPGAGPGAGPGGTGIFGGRAANEFTAVRQGALTGNDRERWIANGVAFAPWAFNLKIDTATVTGDATQAHFDAASGYATTLTGPFEVSEGAVDGSKITFKLKTPDDGRVITFVGIREGDQIVFDRSVQVVRGDPGRDGIHGASGATHFTARLDNGRSAAPAAPPPTAATGPVGRWQTTQVANGPWVFNLTPNGSALTGTIQQSGRDSNPVSIAAGKIDGTTISFKVLSPDGERIITFHGRINGREISFVRQIDVLAGGTPGGNDLFGGSAPLQFVAVRTN